MYKVQEFIGFWKVGFYVDLVIRNNLETFYVYLRGSINFDNYEEARVALEDYKHKQKEKWVEVDQQ